MTGEDIPQTYTPEQVAARNPRLSAWALRNAVREGRIPCLRIGARRQIAFTVEHVQEALRYFEVPAVQSAPGHQARRPAPPRRAPSASQGQRAAAPAVELRARPPRRARKGGGDDAA